ncbi:MAG TPA: fused MFS/spermidine synthase [Nitrospiria bacterium]|nr:fused MFS/spermidine synthase [Nitrospiria bacterium]
MNWIGNIILLCFFLSGASGLIYEVIWLRMLVLVFGSTTLAVSTVLAAFMGGLALGSLWFGRIIDRWRRPLYTYGILEGCIGLYGLLVPLLFPLLVPLYQITWDLFNPSIYVFNLIRFVLVMAVLLIPTTLMGATLPVLASSYAGRKEPSERRIGLLYAFNTSGAVLGTFATGFILLPSLGVQKTTLIAATLNLLLGLTVVWISQRKSHLIGPSMMKTDRDHSYEDLGQPEPSFAAMAFKNPPEERSSGGIAIGLTLAALAISGYTALVYEVAWTRVLSLVLGSSVYAFSTMLTTFLLGLALGSLLFTQILNRIKWPIGTFAVVQIGIALACYATTALLQKLPYFFLQAMAWGLPSFQDHPDWLIMALWFAAALLIMIIPTLLFGGTFPLVVKIYHLYSHKMGRTAGDVYSINTLGAISGAFLGGFILIPSLGLQSTLLMTILVNLAIGLLLILAAPFRRTKLQRIIGLSILVLGAGVFWIKIPWNPTMMTFNLGIEYPRYLEVIKDLQGKGWSAFNQKMAKGLEVIFYEEGSTATVSVVRDSVGHHYLKNDGRPEGGEPYLRTHVLLGHLPLLLSASGGGSRGGQDKDSVLIIGLGTGVTLGSAQQHPLKRLEVVELEPAVIRASDYFRNISPHRMDDPRLKVTVNDGRNHLLASRDTYNNIISQPSFPWLTGVSNLFTQDFFRLGAQRLRKGGIFCQWISVYGMTQEGFKSVLKAFHTAFPYVMVFDPAPPDMIFIGSDTPIQIDLDALEEKLKIQPIKADLERIGIQNSYDLLATFSLGSNEIDTYLAGAVTNTDDNAWVEVSGPRDYYTGRINGQPEAIRDDLYNTQRGIEKYLVSRQDLTQAQKAAQVLALAQAYFRQGNLAYASFYADRSLNLEETAEGHLLMARLLVAYTQKTAQGSPPASDSQDILRAAIKALQVALGLNPRLTEALQLQAELNKGLGEIEQAILSYQRLVEIDAQNPDAHYTLAALLQAQGRHTEARRHYQKFLLMAGQSEAYSGLVDLAQKQLEAMGQRGSR